MGPSGKCLPILCPCVFSWEGVWRPEKIEVKWSPLPGSTGSLYISKSDGGREERGKEWMGDSGKDTHLEIFHMCLDPILYLCTVCLLWQQTQTMWRGRGEFAISQKVPLRHALNTLVTWTLGLAWIAWLAGKTEVDPVLKSFIPVGRLNKCYAAAGTLSVLFVLPQVLIRDSDNFCVLRGSEEVRRCCQSSKNHVVLYDWLNPLTMVGLTY